MCVLLSKSCGVAHSIQWLGYVLEPREICIQLPTASAISDIATASIPNLWPNQMPTNCVLAVKVFGVCCKTHLSLYMMRKVERWSWATAGTKRYTEGCNASPCFTSLQPTELGTAARHAIVSFLFSSCFFKTQQQFRSMKREDQQDATIRCLLITSVSTCFGHHYSHLQENKGRVTAFGVLFWFC